MSSLLKLTDIVKSFAGVRALKGVSFELAPGEVHALVGENGAGKSTLIKVISGAHRPDSGSLEIAGQPIDQNDPTLSKSLGVAVIYQQPALFPDLTVSENIALRLERGGPWCLIRWGERRRRAQALLDRVGATISPDAYVRELTMPQQQLVEIASALGGDAKVLILDEPTASLSDREVDNLFRVIRELRQQEVGMIYISHRLEELPKIADRVTVLRDGAYVATKPMSEVDRAEMIRLMVGRSLEAVFPKVDVPLGDVVLETRDLSCKESGVQGVSITVRAGEILGLAGLVGAGRTELARTLFGLTPATAGQILLKGAPVRVTSPARAVTLGIAYVPEDRRRHGVILDMPVAANATLAILDRLAAFGLIRFSRERDVATSFVQRLGVKTPSIATPVGNLSGGNQQKVAVARWLATEPAVIILDEPTQGVDVGAKAEIHKLMGELAQRGLAIIMISSELPEVLGMSDRIAVMHAGQIIGELPRAQATQEKILELALGHQGGVASATRSPRRSPTMTSLTQPLISARPTLASRHLREFSVLAAYLLLLLILAIASPRFYQAQFAASWVNAAPVLVAAVGMTLVILARHIDISIGSQFSICGVVAGLLAKSGLPMPAVACCTIAAGAVMGAFNGLFVALMGLPSIVVTLATMVILREGLRWIRQGDAVRGLPDHFQWFGHSQFAGQLILITVAAVVFASFAWGMRFCAAGRAVFAVGSDQEAARLAGVRPPRVVFTVFVLMGALTGLASLLSTVRLPQVDPNAGTGLELQVIAAVVVGGVAISGGRGTLLGTLIGVALLGTIGSALVFLDSHAANERSLGAWERAIQGAIILVAVASDGIGRRTR